MKLPLLLCGPIIRRVEPHCVYIWVALSSHYDIESELFQINSKEGQPAFNYQHIDHQTETKSIQLGEQLYVKLIKITPANSPFPTQTLLGYNLIFNQLDHSDDLESLGLLSPDSPHSIIYGTLKYPTFYIHNGSNPNILYGSCRKFHGKGQDSLTSGDLLLNDVYQRINERPNSLFLIGDQIYADDIPDPLFPILTTIGNLVVGNKKENLVAIEPRLAQDPYNRSINQIQGRQFIMENFCGFTSNHAHNHLIRFEEYAVLYLLSWSPELWHLVQENNLLPTFKETDMLEKRYFIYPDEERFHKEHHEEYIKHQTRYKDQIDPIRNSISTISNIRRLMANTPTYMIFDDHEITDDWNISEDWAAKVKSTPLGEHVVANGLTSYWAFQGWGNDPESFGDDFLQTIDHYYSSDHSNLQHYEDWVRLMWNYDQWSFVAPTKPTTVFLDTRTQRSYEFVPYPIPFGKPFVENKQGPNLIKPSGWDMISKKLTDSGWRECDPLIIVSPAPVYGLGLIESFLFDYVYPFKFLGIPMDTTLDFESWKYNGKGFTSFLQTVAKWNPSHCFILSGDVHLASAVKSLVDFHNGQQLQIFQFTSSPLHNISYNDLWANLVKVAIWLNTKKRKNHDTHRYYDSREQIIEDDKRSLPSSRYVWKDRIRYLALENSSLVEIENNLGHLIISPSVVNNTLLSYDGFQLQKKIFEPIYLYQPDA